MPRIFPPRRVKVPDGFWRNGRGSTRVRCAWGSVRVSTQRLKSRAGKQAQVLLDAALDASGWSPKAPAALLDLVARLPFEEASVVAGNFGIRVSDSELERFAKPYGEACRAAVGEALADAPEVPSDPKRPGRVMVLQVDGVYALGRPAEGACPGVELKTAVIYPQSAPQERWLLAGRHTRTRLQQVDGLTRVAGVAPQDELIGLCDGAA